MCPSLRIGRIHVSWLTAKLLVNKIRFNLVIFFHNKHSVTGFFSYGTFLILWIFLGFIRSFRIFIPVMSDFEVHGFLDSVKSRAVKNFEPFNRELACLFQDVYSRD